MALLDSEIVRIRAELGYPVLTSAAEPYIGIAAVFETIIQTYTVGGASTTSATSVTPESPPVPTTIVLASATGFTAGDRVVIDVDSRQETVTTQALSGTSLTALLTKLHTGTYPVTVEGSESIVRALLTSIFDSRAQRSKSKGRGALKAYVGDIEYYDTGKSAYASATSEINGYRDELAAILGVENRMRSVGGGGRVALY